MKLSRPRPDSPKPTKSKRPTSRSLMFWMKRSASAMPSAPIGRLIQKIQRQWK